VYQWLRLVQVLQQKEGCGTEAEQNRQIIRGDIVGQSHVWISERRSARGVKCNVGKGIVGFLASDAGVEGVRSASRPAGESVQILKARLTQGVYNGLGLWRIDCGGWGRYGRVQV